MLKDELHKYSESKYAKFADALNKTKWKILGVRVPKMRELCKTEVRDNENWYNNFKPECFEDVFCYGICIGYSKLPLSHKIKLFDDYLKYCDSWALIDNCMMTLKVNKDEIPVLWEWVRKLSLMPGEFERRTAVVLCLSKFLNDEYIERVVELFDNIKSGEYYVDMAIAWAIAEMLVKQPDYALEIIQNKKLPKWIQNKSIQKARESFRISAELKNQLLSYKL